MTEPLKLNIGGVSYQADQVASYDSKTRTRKDDSGKLSAAPTRYDVELKDGTKIRYFEQGPEQNASIFQKTDKNGTTTTFSGLFGAEITDTPNDDKYILSGCTFTKVDADRMTEEKGGFFNKKVISVDSDLVRVEDRINENGSIDESEHNYFYLSGDPGDNGVDYLELQEDNVPEKATPINERYEVYFQHGNRRARDTIN